MVFIVHTGGQSTDILANDLVDSLVDNMMTALTWIALYKKEFVTINDDRIAGVNTELRDNVAKSLNLTASYNLNLAPRPQ